MAQMTIPEAARLLDEKVPGWAEKIDVESLDMLDGYRCILGYVYGDYSCEAADDLRFCSETGTTRACFDEWASETEWIEEIRIRFPVETEPVTDQTQNLKLIKQLQAAGHPDIADALLTKMLANV